MARPLASLYGRAPTLPDGASAPPVLTSPRLRLRPFEGPDAGLLARYAGEAHVARMTSTIPHPYPPGAAEAFIEASASLASGAAWAIDGRPGGLPSLVGTIGLRRPGPESCEIGYWIAPPFWNGGLATEAVRAVVADDPFGPSRIRGVVFQDNPASARVLEAAGFSRTGEGESYSVARGETVATWIYALSRSHAA